MKARVLPWLLAALVGATGCSATRGSSVAVDDVLEGAADDLDPASFVEAARATADALDARDPGAEVRIGDASFTGAELAASARRALELASGARDGAALAAALAANCRAFPAAAPARVTGYFEPLLRGSLERDERHRWPLYRMPSPAQLETVAARLGRAPRRDDIDGHDALAGLGLELAWVDDPVDRFFLQVQGSGRLDLGGGRTMRLGFAGTNGLDYRSVGAVMLEKGLLERGAATAPAMRAWLAAHPADRDALLATNPRYVFFRDRGNEAVTGSLGAPLVAGRSVAADPAAVPPGTLAWLATTQPLLDAAGRAVSRRPVTRFVFAQDTGAAIRGEARVDLFTGSGNEAGLAAGGMNEAGRLAVVLCDGAAPKRRSSLATRPLPGPRMPGR